MTSSSMARTASRWRPTSCAWPTPRVDREVEAAGLLMWHWLDSEAPDGNRSQYLDEAADLAAAGAVCLLPQGRFPWSSRRRVGRRLRCDPGRGGSSSCGTRPPGGTARRGRLDGSGWSGHDFGGMIAAVEAADEDRLKALVIVAATPRWGGLVPALLADRRGSDRLSACDAVARSHRSGSGGPVRRPSCSSSGAATSSSPR